jgi:hypothetical protein
MSYKNLVKNKVRSAFGLIGDLAFDATFVKTVSIDFDFASQEMSSTQVSLTVKAVDLETRKKSRKANVYEKTLLCMTEDIPDINDFDSIKINGVTWKIAGSENNGYTIFVDLVRETHV